MTKNQTHEWHERTDDGRKRYLRAHWDSRQWRITVLEPDAERWTRVENPPVELWLALRDVLWRKYQRRRVPLKMVERVDALLGDAAPKNEESSQ